VLALTLAAVLLMFTNAAFATDSSDYRVVDGLAIYYAAIPAEIIRGHPKGHPEAVMHGGVPAGKHVHHLMIALFDGNSLERITDAKVTATVSEVGLAPTQLELEPFSIADALTYGNYFEFSNLATYTIDIAVRRPGSSDIVKTRFEYRHH
jgi:hypothetical protein